MSWGDRVRRRWRPNDSSLEQQTTSNNDVIITNLDDDGQQQVQYRLESTEKQRHASFFQRLIHCWQRPTRRAGGIGGISNANQQLAMYLHWMFRVNFIFLFAVMCVMFFALVIFFAGVITIVGTIDEECVRIGSEKFGAADTAFADAFALSWTVSGKDRHRMK